MINKIDKPLSSHTVKKDREREKTQITNIRNKRGQITTYTPHRH